MISIYSIEMCLKMTLNKKFLKTEAQTKQHALIFNNCFFFFFGLIADVKPDVNYFEHFSEIRLSFQLNRCSWNLQRIQSVACRFDIEHWVCMQRLTFKDINKLPNVGKKATWQYKLQLLSNERKD